MDYRDIEIFRTIMVEGSVTGAARVLGVSQPAISSALRKFETELGFTLFRRHGRRVSPTAEAKLLDAEASRLLNGFERFGLSADEISAGQRGSLTIATHPNPASSWLPALTADFQRNRPHVHLRFLSRSAAEVRELAASSAFDLGIALPPFSNAELVLERYSMPRVVVLPRAHRLAAQKVLTPTLLSGENMIAIVRASWDWALIARAFDQAKATCHVIAECELMATALGLVASGAGVCLADPITAAHVSPSLIHRPFVPATPYELGVLSPAHGQLTILASLFAQAIDAYVSPYLSRV